MNHPSALLWILRVAVAACFIGHGAFGLITKAAWLPYFAVFGIPEAWAWKLMPVIGAVDISVGVLTLAQPVRAVILYMALWGFQTACLRPLAGQGVWELLERAGNYGVPLALLCLLGAGRSAADWFSARPAIPLTMARAAAIGWILRLTTALLLVGHGAFGVFMHKDWSGYAAIFAISPATLSSHPLTSLAGWFECALGVLVLVWPARGVLVFVAAWKLGTELLRPLAGEPVWEFVERGGSYGAPLALAHPPRDLRCRRRAARDLARAQHSCGACLARLRQRQRRADLVDGLDPGGVEDGERVCIDGLVVRRRRQLRLLRSLRLAGRLVRTLDLLAAAHVDVPARHAGCLCLLRPVLMTAL